MQCLNIDKLVELSFSDLYSWQTQAGAINTSVTNTNHFHFPTRKEFQPFFGPADSDINPPS